MLLSIIAFILLLSTLVFVHELGHFLVAKWTGMRVDEFNIGFPPRLFTYRRGDTLYSLNAILLGGYVKIHGENPQEPSDDEQDSFQHKPVWARMLVIVAGVTMNLLFAFVVLSIAFSVGFVSVSQNLQNIQGATVTSSRVILVETLAHSPSEAAGMQPGDFIDRFQDIKTGKITTISTTSQLRTYTLDQQAANNHTLKVSFNHEGNEVSSTINLNPTGPPLGAAIEDYKEVRVPVWRAPEVAAKEVAFIVGATWVALKDFFSQLFIHAHLDQSVSGPVGVYKATDSATHEGFGSLVFLSVVLSINLALFNILPIPALDGGRFAFLLIELVFRKKVIAERVEAALYFVSFIAIIAFSVILTIKDIIHLF